jgi:hypothetical protein
MLLYTAVYSSIYNSVYTPLIQFWHQFRLAIVKYGIPLLSPAGICKTYNILELYNFRTVYCCILQHNYRQLVAVFKLLFILLTIVIGCHYDNIEIQIWVPLPLTSLVRIRLVNRIYQTHLIGWWSLNGSGSGSQIWTSILFKALSLKGTTKNKLWWLEIVHTKTIMVYRYWKWSCLMACKY